MVESPSVGRVLASVGCWSCKARRVRCDRNLPGCLNCARVRTKCQGYGVRLSWPKENDHKRAMLGKSPPRRKNWTRPPNFHIIHASFREMEIYSYLVDPYDRKIRNSVTILPDQLLMPFTSLRNPGPLVGREAELVQYFASTAFSSLVIFNQNAADFRNLLIQTALSNGNAASRAVLFALLAVSSQYRDGLQPRAVEFKTSAISALAESVKSGTLGTTEAAQHVAAGMLLCSFEIQASSETTGQWLWYIRGVKDIIKTNHLDKRTNIGFVAELLDWVYYHDVMAQFSILHWRQGPVETMLAKQLGIEGWDCILDAKGPQMIDRIRPSHLILQFLSEVFNVLSLANEEPDRIENCIGSLNLLEGKASTVGEISERYGTLTTEASTNATAIIRLYHMAAVIYLARVSESISGEMRNIELLLDNAFALLCQMDTCELQFPLLILGYEARTDEQRILVLDIVQRTEEKSYGRPIDCLRGNLKTMWVQEDLACDDEFVPTYMDKLSSIISTTRFIPSLV